MNLRAIKIGAIIFTLFVAWVAVSILVAKGLIWIGEA